jgi:PilZ domain-containing protein
MPPLPRAKRVPTNHDGMIYGTDGARIAPCRLRNVSATGAQIELSREIELPKKFLVSLSESGQLRRHCTIVWQFSTVVGIHFTPPEI